VYIPDFSALVEGQHNPPLASLKEKTDDARPLGIVRSGAEELIVIYDGESVQNVCNCSETGGQSLAATLPNMPCRLVNVGMSAGRHELQVTQSVENIFFCSVPGSLK
jgi:hypothetical protein